MVASGERDDTRFAAMEQGGLNRNFDCLEAGIAQSCFSVAESPPLEGDLALPLAEEGLVLPRMHVSHSVQQFGRLIDQCCSNRGVGVAVPYNCEAPGEVQETILVDVPNIRSRSSLPKNREVWTDIGHVSIFVFRKQRR